MFAQAVLGGLSVLFDLKPPFVMAHFLLTIVVVAIVIYLELEVQRVRDPVLDAGEA